MDRPARAGGLASFCRAVVRRGGEAAMRSPSIFRFGVPILLLLSTGAVASPGPTTPTFVLAWGKFGSAPDQFQFPSGVATDALGNVYVAQQNGNRIQKFDRLGNFILTWGSSGAGNGQFNGSIGPAVDPTGNVYVTDANNHRVQKFSSTGAYL